jgi:UTP--glucose-1-phosphate uridylyltransferase
MSSRKPIRKAVFPVAGLGTRFLPATKSIPKEMLPIVDKPLIQYAVEEAMEAGIDTLVFITSRKKHAISDHCLGHAILCAAPVIGDEPFAIVLADDMIRNEGPGALAQMVDVYRETGSSVIGVEEIPQALTSSYGIVATRADQQGRLAIDTIVEKPRPEEAPSRLGVVGRYLLDPSIFDYLRSVQPGAGGEIQLTDGIAALLATHPVLALPLVGERYDCGSRHGYIKATIEYAMDHEDIREDMLDHMQSVLAREGRL